MRTRAAMIACCAIVALASCTAAFGQNAYPVRPVRIVTAAVGGASDFAARVLANELTSVLGRPIIVENRPGGSGIIAAQTVIKSGADGHTLLLFSSPIWLLPLMQENVPYDPIRDFTAVSQIDRAPSVLVVHPSLPVQNVRELIALAKARAGQLNYSRASAGGPSHLSAELFQAQTGTRLVQVAYKGGGPAALAVVTGEVELTFASASAASAPLQSKRLRALAVTTAERSPLFPDLPTLASAGLGGFECVLMNGLFAAAGTPAAVVTRLNQEVAQIVRRDEVKARFATIGVETVGSSSASFASTVKAEINKWGPLIKSAGIRAD